MTVLPHHLSTDGVIDLGPATLLAEHGFRRKGRNFSRVREPFVESVYFQAFRGAPFSFCIALSLILPYHHFVTRGTKLPGSPSIDNASRLASTRVEFPTDDGINHWLVVTRDAPAEAVASLVTSRLPEALTFFDNFRSVEHVIAATQAENGLVDHSPHINSLNLAVLLAYTGQRQQALATLATLPLQAIPRGLKDRLLNAQEGSPNPSLQRTPPG
jgi:hypothetical protein